MAADSSSHPREAELAELERVILADPSSPAAIEAIGKLSKKEKRRIQATLPGRVKAPKPLSQPRKRVKVVDVDSEAEIAMKFSRAAVESIPFAETIWEMMYSFGDSRSSFACSCLQGGETEKSPPSPAAGKTKKSPQISAQAPKTPAQAAKSPAHSPKAPAQSPKIRAHAPKIPGLAPKICRCLEPVQIIEEAVRPFIRGVVMKAREESEKRSFGTKHLQAIMPREMSEYMRWRKQRDNSTDPVEAKASGGGSDAGGGNGGSSSSSGPRRVEDEDAPVLQELEADDTMAVGADDFQEAEMDAIMEEMSSAGRMLLRREFADARSRKMKTDKYAAFARRRETFFFPSSGTRARTAQALFREWSGVIEPPKKAGVVPKSPENADGFGMRGKIAGTMGRPAAVGAAASGGGRGGGGGRGNGKGPAGGSGAAGSAAASPAAAAAGAAAASSAAAAASPAASPTGAKGRKSAVSGGDGGVSARTLQALAFLAYDRLGMIVETAITRRYGGQLRDLPRKKPLKSDEVRSAAVAVRIACEGIGDSGTRCVGAVIPKFRRGLKHRGDPLDWPCNVFRKGQLLVGGGPDKAEGGGGGAGGSAGPMWQDLDAIAAEAQALADSWGF